MHLRLDFLPVTLVKATHLTFGDAALTPCLDQIVDRTGRDFREISFLGYRVRAFSPFDAVPEGFKIAALGKPGN
jgi:hypothetical protein